MTYSVSLKKFVPKVKKELWFECPVSHRSYFNFVMAQIEKPTGRLIPVCDLQHSNLIRRVKEVVNSECK